MNTCMICMKEIPENEIICKNNSCRKSFREFDRLSKKHKKQEIVELKEEGWEKVNEIDPTKII
jgi:hypothetical protein